MLVLLLGHSLLHELLVQLLLFLLLLLLLLGLIFGQLLVLGGFELLLLRLELLLFFLSLLLLEQLLMQELPRQLFRSIDHHVAVVFDGCRREYLDILLEILQCLACLSDHVSVDQVQQF